MWWNAVNQTFHGFNVKTKLRWNAMAYAIKCFSNLKWFSKMACQAEIEWTIIFNSSYIILLTHLHSISEQANETESRVRHETWQHYQSVHLCICLAWICKYVKWQLNYCNGIENLPSKLRACHTGNDAEWACVPVRAVWHNMKFVFKNLPPILKRTNARKLFQGGKVCWYSASIHARHFNFNSSIWWN